MKKLMLTCISLLAAHPLTAEDKAIPTYTSSVHVYASSEEFTGSQYHQKIVGIIDGQPVLLFAEYAPYPLLSGDYKIRILKDKTVHQAEVMRQYALLFPDGTEQKFDLIGLCAKGTAICYGIAIPVVPQ